MAVLTHACDIRGRRVARANLSVLFGGRMTSRRRRILVRGCYRQAAQVALDSFWFGRDTRTRVGAWTRLEPVLRAKVETTRPGLLVTAHYGNWEMTLLVGGYLGLPLTAVVKAQRIAWVTERLNRLRRTLGVKVVFDEGALRVLLKELRQGGMAGFVVDQDTAIREGGVWVDFAGLPATVTNGVAVLSRHTQAAVFLIFPHTRPNGRYDFFGEGPLMAEPDETDTAFTQRITHGLLRRIRRHPSQWLLMYPRWSVVPDGDSCERFPFYARRASRRPGADSRHPAGQDVRDAVEKRAKPS